MSSVCPSRMSNNSNLVNGHLSFTATIVDCNLVELDLTEIQFRSCSAGWTALPSWVQRSHNLISRAKTAARCNICSSWLLESVLGLDTPNIIKRSYGQPHKIRFLKSKYESTGGKPAFNKGENEFAKLLKLLQIVRCLGCPLHLHFKEAWHSDTILRKAKMVKLSIVGQPKKVWVVADWGVIQGGILLWKRSRQM